MPKIEVSRQDLFAQARIEDPGDEKLADLLSLVKGEIDSSNGDLLKLELNDTNRPDLWCVEGVARALRCWNAGAEPHLNNLPEPDMDIFVDPGLEQVRPFVAAFTACGWTPDQKDLDALIDVQVKLATSFGKNRKTAGAGFYRLDDIEFPINYRAASPKTTFIPLGYDEEMTLSEILTDTETGRTFAHLLEGKDLWPLLEDSRGKVLSFPPVLNSQTTGRVSAGDSRLFCEVTGTDWETVQLSATILACNLQDRGAEILPIRINYPQPYPGRTVVTPVIFRDRLAASMESIHGILGMDISPESAREALLRMDYASVELDSTGVTGVLPPYRRDGIQTVDMIEDIVISLGFSYFEPLLPEQFTLGKCAPIEDLADAVRILLAGARCEEILRPVLTSRAKVKDLTRTPGDPVSIANPMTAEYGVVRNTLLPGLLEVESTSAHAAYPHRIFETGEILAIGKDGFCRTEVLLACLICGNKADFGDAHSIIGSLCHSRAIGLSLADIDDDRFIPGRCAAITIDGRVSGVIGELHPAVLNNWGISSPASAFEIALSALKG
ncbi:phenylalanine--tRNA ligase subunit beta [Candidatus Fermentibacteria bacterium]|nr:MAG: phenylalanine--tRNA ligase subunit beta [Candidatus Fermentibacteria bacterium]